jgi:hypothetical protein
VAGVAWEVRASEHGAVCPVMSAEEGRDRADRDTSDALRYPPRMRILLVVLIACGGGPEGRDGTKSTTTTVDTGEPEVWTSGVIACADPSRRAEAPFDRQALPTQVNSSIWLWAGGAIAVDWNGDDRVDILAPAETYTKSYTQTAAGTFAEDTAAFGLDLPWGTGGSAADYDGDGDLDLYLTRFDLPNVLLQNDGTGRFTDVTEQAGVPAGNYRTMSSSWADYDRDGDLDLFVGNYGWVDESGENATSDFQPAEPSFLYVNRGDGTFDDQSAQLPQQVHDGYTYVSGWHDLDGDGWLDLYIINDFGAAYPNVLLWNREGTLEADGGLSGLDLQMTGMGLGIGELNGDGLPDLLIPEWNKVRLLQSTAGGFWIDYSALRGVSNDVSRGQKVGWGAALDDFDNDGDLDGFVAYGRVRYINEVWTNPPYQPDALYQQDDAGDFADVGEAWGLADDGVGRGFAVADLNDDGWLDLFKRDLDGPDLLYMSRCGAESWLRVQLRDPGMNHFAIGARVEVHSGDQVWWRVVRAGGVNYASSGPPEVHFGLGAHDAVDRVVVHWPDGGMSEYAGIDGRQIVRIHRRP